MNHRLMALEKADIAPVHPGVMIARDLKAKHITPEQFARRCELPISQVKKMICGKADIDDAALRKMKTVLRDDVDVIQTQRYMYDYYKTHKRRPKHIPAMPMI